MTRPLSSETIHASTVAIGGRAVLIWGRSGSGKSDLALRLIDRGAKLVSDDYTLVKRTPGGLVASAPATIAGRMEVRGLGIVAVEAAPGETPVSLVVDLDGERERMPPEELSRPLLGVAVPLVRLDPWLASAPIRVELALRQLPKP